MLSSKNCSGYSCINIRVSQSSDLQRLVRNLPRLDNEISYNVKLNQYSQSKSVGPKKIEQKVVPPVRFPAQWKSAAGFMHYQS